MASDAALLRRAAVSIGCGAILAALVLAPTAAAGVVAFPGAPLADPGPPAAPAVGSAYVARRVLDSSPGPSAAGVAEAVVEICRRPAPRGLRLAAAWIVPEPALVDPTARRVTFKLCAGFLPPPGGSGLGTLAGDWEVHVVFGATPWWGIDGEYALGPTAPVVHTPARPAGGAAARSFGYLLVLTQAGKVVDVLDPTLVISPSGTEPTVDSARFSEHFRCYEVSDRLARTPGRVFLDDQFGSGRARLGRATVLCNPARKNSEPFSERRAHLVCHPLTARGSAGTVVIETQLGVEAVRVGRPERLCVPSLKRTLPRRPPPGRPDPATLLDHFRCHAVARKPESRQVTLTDQFETKRTVLVALVRLCAPASKQHEGVRQPQAHLACYAIRDAPGQPRFKQRNVVVRNQFGVRALRVRRVESLCLPAHKLEPFPPHEPEDPAPPGLFFGARCSPKKQTIPHGGKATIRIVALPGSVRIQSAGLASSQPGDTGSYSLARAGARRFTFTSKNVDPPARVEHYVLRFRVRFGTGPRRIVASIVKKCQVFVIHDEVQDQPPVTTTPSPDPTTQPTPTPTPTPTQTPTFTFSVTRTGPGTVTSDPAGITCGSDCTGTFDSGTSVVLTAQPDASLHLRTWGGDCQATPNTASCTLLADGDRSLSAAFAARLRVDFTGTGTGTVQFSPPGDTCTDDCDRFYDPPIGVTLQGQGTPPDTFTDWGGACDATAAPAPCNLSMSQSREVSVQFTDG